MAESKRVQLLIRTSSECVFCAIVAGEAPATIVRRWPDAVAIVPQYPVTDGHLLVIPARHVSDFTSKPTVSALAMLRASELAEPPANVITSAGSEATQTVRHLHLHVGPRRTGDGLALPWTTGQVSDHG